MWPSLKTNATNTHPNQIAATQQDVKQWYDHTSVEDRKIYDSLFAKLQSKINENEGLDKIDNLVLKRVIHEVFPMGEEQEMIIFTNIMHSKMSNRFAPVALCLANIEVCATVVIQGGNFIWSKGSDIINWISHGTNYRFIFEGTEIKYCNGFFQCVKWWHLLYSPAAHKNRLFYFRGNGTMVRDYAWHHWKVGNTWHWFFSDGDRGFETTETGYVMNRTHHNQKRNYRFNEHGWCLNP